MTNILNIIQIVSAVLLILAVLAQHRGTTLGGAFGGETSVFSSRRGPEKFLFIVTIILAVTFVVTAVINVLK